MTMLDHRKGDWIQTFTGGRFWPLDPRAEEIHLEDVAHALSQLCRFTGHTRAFYSVAQHSVMVSRMLGRREDQRWGLLHDAAEAYLGDQARPIKGLLYLGGGTRLLRFHLVEERVLGCVAERFGLPGSMPGTVRLADRQALRAEAEALMGPAAQEWACKLPEYLPRVTIEPWGPERAKREFLARFDELFGEGAR
ncbi:MAG: phosphohydrolase [Desulfurellales bacterium]|nr:MAG: phosphohydrolase [Desulfurellales bacterium]